MSYQAAVNGKNRPMMPDAFPQTPQGIPLLGMGTWPLKGDECIAAILTALEVGFRHIDTAQMYGNEHETGIAISKSSLPRQNLFIVTKISPENVSQSRFLTSLQQSLAALGVGHVDLLLIHWPPRSDFDGTIERLVTAQEAGLTNKIGVSNFPIAMMQRAQNVAGGRLVNNQVEFQPLLDQSRLKTEARKLGICLSAYSPLGRGLVLKEPVIIEIAKRLNRPPSEVALRWIVQQGVIAIPMTTKRENAASNFKALDLTLSDADMASISTLNGQNRRLISPSMWAPQWDN